MLKPRIILDRAHDIHGTGCALSTLISSYLFQGEPLPAACQKAKNRMHELISSAQENPEKTQFLWPFAEK
jgi:hydroxymethylpyrimidine/phosphomethylpyrimidine kinase